MRLLISVFFPRSIRLEGIHTIIDSLATSFTQKGVDTTVLFPIGNKERNNTEEVYRSIDYLSGQKATSPRMLLNYMRIMTRLIKQFDVVQLVDIAPSYLMLSERWSKHASHVYDLIEGPSLSSADLSSKHLSIQYLNHWFIKNLFWASLPKHRCKSYIVSSQYQREQLLSLNIPTERVKVIPFGIHPDRVRSLNKAKARQLFGLTGRQVIGYLGHFSPMKGVPTLLRAFERIASQNTSATLFLAWSGKGIESRKVLRMIERMSCRNQVKLVGKVNVSQFLAACDVIALPYVTSSIPHFPLVLTEAFASRVPVITTKVGGLSEIVKQCETGLLVGGDLVDELSKALSLLLKDSSLCETISANAYQVFQTVLNSDVTASALIKLYQEGV